MTDHTHLDQGIFIRLVTTREPIKRAFAGTGRSRRREKSSAHWIAQSITTGILGNHRIERGGVAVAEAEIVELLADELWKVPEVVAKDLVGIDATKRDDAKVAITRALLSALTSLFECTFFQPGYRGMGPSSHSQDRDIDADR